MTGVIKRIVYYYFWIVYYCVINYIGPPKLGTSLMYLTIKMIPVSE